MTYTFNAELLEDAARLLGDTTRTAIANRTGLDEGSISRYLTGKRKPDYARASRIANTYGLPIGELLIPAA